MVKRLGARRSQRHSLANLWAPRAVATLAILAIIAALYFAKPILVPLAIAIVLTFVLAPPVRWLRSWGGGRITSVIVAVVLAFGIILTLGALLGQQITQVAETLPQYQFTIQHKIQDLRGAAPHGGTLERISNFLGNLNQEFARKNDKTSQHAQAAVKAPAPMPVEVHQPDPTPGEVIVRVVQPLLEPLTTIGLVIIFVFFFLLQREDLRDRLIRLAGSHDLQRTTEALNDAARRLSRYFLAQTGLNALFGTVVGTGLAFIGVPNPFLWGIVAMVLRFVPYIGGIFAAAFPIALAIAADPGWTMVLWTIGLFLVIEFLIGQVLEPVFYGHSTGLTPVAVIIAATFWTWLWGPIGLLLSTPLTVCLGVLGRHVEGLQALDVLIGDEPPLTPAQSFYQRTLAGDSDEAADQAEQMLKRCALSTYYDEIVLQGLILAEIDVRRGGLDDEQISQINETVEDLIVDLSDYADTTPAAGARPPKEGASPPESESDQGPRASSSITGARAGGPDGGMGRR